MKQDPALENFKTVFGTAMQVAQNEVNKLAQQAADQASKAAQDWKDSNWQLKKRPGQILPEIRPNAIGVTQTSNAILTQASEDQTQPPTNQLDAAATSSALASQTSPDLKAEFTAFLATKEEENIYHVTERGEVVFASEQELSNLVVSFTSKKLQNLAVASRALARYVNDLERELEAADDAVVELRQEEQRGAKRQRELQSRAMQLEADLTSVKAQLADTEARYKQEEEARLDIESRAEAAAASMLKLQAQEDELEGEMKDAVNAEKARILELEERLMRAEAEASTGEDLRRKLADTQARLAEERTLAAAAMETERERVQLLEQKAAAAEARADQKAVALRESLSQSETTISAMSELLQEQESAIDGKDSDHVQGKSLGDDARAAQQTLLQQLLDSGAKVSGDAEIGASNLGSVSALSRMNKADLIAECKERGVEPSGSVAELRARLRVERKRSALVASLVERGWSERQCRRALEQEAWDSERALERLLGR